MAEMRDIDPSAADWFNDKPPMHWSRSHFTTNSICDFLLNNCCESFNNSIFDAREKFILSMLEWLVEYFMTRMQVNRDRAEEKWEGLFCPRIRKLIEKNLTKTGDCIPIKADNFHYQVSCYDGSKYSVDLKEWACGCRKWDLSGIPCNHALSAILAQRLDYFDYVHKCYNLATYKQVYSPIVMPLNGRSEWQPTGVIPVLPPNFGRPVGRPKRARRMERDKAETIKTKRKNKIKTVKNDHEMRRQQRTVTCSICGVKGHNKKGCTQTEPVRPVESEQIEQSQEHPLSQLTEELIGQPPSKLQVRRNTRFDVHTIGENDLKKTNIYHDNSSAKDSNMSQPMAQQTTPMPPWRSMAPLSMYEQFKQCQIPSNMANVRAPTPFFGRTYIQSVEPCKSIVQGGQKFMIMSSINTLVSENECELEAKMKKRKDPHK
ncbi:uncharacterized protein LOC121982766 isoform X1 [Zingiber officinale]|nr:uncharacterized protein LOC121982766 isoform X1 [Zingiber officinale]